MNRFKEKLQVFVMGLMAGLIIAGGFFILKLDDYFKELNFYKNVIKTFTAHPGNNKYSEEPESIPVKEKKSTENSTKTKKDITDETLLKKDFVMNADSIAIHSRKDSTTTEKIASEDIIVRKDELLSTKTMEVISLNVLGRSNSKDSLLQKVSGIKEDKNNNQQFFNIEFWTSPLNYKGYKMSKYKIVLYGLATTDGLKIYKLDDVIYLKTTSLVFKLDYISEFKPYEHITDEMIINKLK